MAQRRTPAYGLHKATGQAVVRIDGHDNYLGKHGSQESLAAYQVLIDRWRAARTAPRPRPGSAPTDIAVVEIILKFVKHLEGRVSAGELDNVRLALRPLRLEHGSLLAHTFTAEHLLALQEQMAKQDLARATVNSRVGKIRRCFKWAASMRLVPVSIYHDLTVVEGLREGDLGTRETEPVQPVLEEHVKATLPHLPPPVRVMVQLHLLSGMRPSEVFRMRLREIDRTPAVWAYRPAKHKTKRRGKDRVVFLGPQAQQALIDYLAGEGDLGPDDYVFSPRRWTERQAAERAVKRQTRRQPSQLKRRRKTQPKRMPGELYTRRSYRQAIVRACARAQVPRWTPLQVRHTTGTALRAKYGLEDARTVLGHSRVETTQIYAERDQTRAEQIMKEDG